MRRVAGEFSQEIERRMAEMTADMQAMTLEQRQEYLRAGVRRMVTELDRHQGGVTWAAGPGSRRRECECA